MEVTSRTESRNNTPLQHDPNYIALTRTLERYQHLILLTSVSDNQLEARLAIWQKRAQAELWSPLPFHRMKWLRSIEGARTLLLKLEQNAHNIKVQRTRREAVKDLAEKRMIIKKLRNRVEEIGREVDSSSRNDYNSQHDPADDDGETMLDVLQQMRRSKGDHTALEQANGTGQHSPPDGSGVEPEPLEEHETEERNRLFDSKSSVRRRRGKETVDEQSFPGKTSGFSNLPETEESLLSSSSQHETITADLLRMAAQLKQQTMQFNFSLDQDKGFIDRAVEGLEQNVSAMGIASKGMKALQRMSEEQGFWGRLKLQLLIGGMWLVAVLLVFVGPKLRF